MKPNDSFLPILSWADRLDSCLLVFVPADFTTLLSSILSFRAFHSSLPLLTLSTLYLSLVFQSRIVFSLVFNSHTSVASFVTGVSLVVSVSHYI